MEMASFTVQFLSWEFTNMENVLNVLKLMKIKVCILVTLHLPLYYIWVIHTCVNLAKSIIQSDPISLM